MADGSGGKRRVNVLLTNMKLQVRIQSGPPDNRCPDILMKQPTEQLIACPECDLLLKEIPLGPDSAAVCCCCGATLYRNKPDSLRRTLAFTLAAAVFYLVANIFPILGIELQGNGNASNLINAVQSMWRQEMRMISTLVFITAILIPALELTILLYLLVPLHLKKQPPGIPVILRTMSAIKPWGMVEVFMLGILVSLVKLQGDFSILPGVALWSFAALTLLLAAVAASFNPRDVWAHLDYSRKEQAEA